MTHRSGLVDRRTFVASITTALAGVRTLAMRRDFAPSGHIRRPFFGALVNANQILRDSPDRLLVERTCREIAIAGPVYWRYSQPERARFLLTDAERLCTFADAVQRPVRAHTLVWHDLLPDWVLAVDDPVELRLVLHSHILGVVSPLRGRIRAWDVVNEPIRPEDARPDGLRLNHFCAHLGPDYISFALIAARSADPDALLGMSDYGLEGDTPRARLRRRSMLALLRGLVSRGVPIDYLGLQAHLSPSDNYSLSGVGDFVNEVRALGLRVRVTELDVDDSTLPADIPRRDALVAETYERFLGLLARTDGVEAVTTWGLRDDVSWLQWYRPRPDGLPQRPLPFDSAGSPKLAWDVLRRYVEVAS